MPCLEDYAGMASTVQALRLYHARHVREIVVVDNRPDGPGGATTRWFLEKCAGEHGPVCRYNSMREPVGTAVAKNRVFSESTSEYTVCVDSHVLLAPGALDALADFYTREPNCPDLIHGPLLSSDLTETVTHQDPLWQGGVWGKWASIRVVSDTDFDIPGMGTGLFASRTDAWLGFHPGMRGFGGEEGVIHEKYRRAGRRVRCLPGLLWWHRFHYPDGRPYPLRHFDTARNYYLGCCEIGVDPTPIRDHFVKSFDDFEPWVWDAIVAGVPTWEQAQAYRPAAATPQFAPTAGGQTQFISG
jgi:hypothetical protein